MVKIAQNENVYLFEAISTVYLPNVRKIKEILGELGKVRISVSNYFQYSSRYDAFKNGEVLPAFDYKKSGGALMD